MVVSEIRDALDGKLWKVLYIHRPFGIIDAEIVDYLIEQGFSAYQQKDAEILSSFEKSILSKINAKAKFIADYKEYSLLGVIEGYPVMYKHAIGDFVTFIKEYPEISIWIYGDSFSAQDVMEYVKEKIDSIIKDYHDKKYHEGYYRRKNEYSNKRQARYIENGIFSYVNTRKDIDDTDRIKEIKRKHKSYTIESPRTSESFYPGSLPKVKPGELVVTRDGRLIPFSNPEERFREQD